MRGLWFFLSKQQLHNSWKVDLLKTVMERRMKLSALSYAVERALVNGLGSASAVAQRRLLCPGGANGGLRRRRRITKWILRIPTDLFFKRQYGCRAMMLETVAAVPGMVGGMLLHLRSLRKFQHSGGWIKALLEEAENERMHLMSMMELVKPKWYEILLVLVVQGVFFNAFFVLYILSPKLAHRIVGYLEEEAVHSYTEYLKGLESGSCSCHCNRLLEASQGCQIERCYHSHSC
ncbi:hypothetical protein VNO78_32729 [Psophocarpus tetragonolobus]|uniref:Ubiquinol oxidase n=1 Tax=Psophocarpus tetragonolobus TaxID=3891 RepID=A0AAN9RPM7_PSOTE